MTKNKTAAKKTEDQSVVYKVPAAFALMVRRGLRASGSSAAYYAYRWQASTALYPMFCGQRGIVFLALFAALTCAVRSC
ncbi:MAG: hypothetical protein ACLUFI_06670 [Oscillospiraceae bacterium]